MRKARIQAGLLYGLGFALTQAASLDRCVWFRDRGASVSVSRRCGPGATRVWPQTSGLLSPRAAGLVVAVVDEPVAVELAGGALRTPRLHVVVLERLLVVFRQDERAPAPCLLVTLAAPRWNASAHRLR